LLSRVLKKLFDEEGVELRGCSQTQSIIECTTATEEDWTTEYLAPILSIKIVDGLDEAIVHINQYSSQHTESIITQDVTKTRRFMREVDSASVMVNASTRFADGFEFGLGHNRLFKQIINYLIYVINKDREHPIIFKERL